MALDCSWAKPGDQLQFDENCAVRWHSSDLWMCVWHYWCMFSRTLRVPCEQAVCRKNLFASFRAVLVYEVSTVVWYGWLTLLIISFPL